MMGKRKAPNDLKTPKALDLGAMHDPQAEHEADMDSQKAHEALTELDPDADEPDLDDETLGREGEVTEGESNVDHSDDEPVLVRTGCDRVIINGHILKDGAVTKMLPVDIANHREHGVALHDVDGEYDEDDFVDTSEPFVAEEKEET